MRSRPRRSKDSEPPDSATARTAALRLLARRDYTSRELRTRLVERGYAPDDVDTLIERLRSEKWLDDRRVAGAHARTASRIKRRGRHRIKRELEARGLDADAIREAIADLPEGNDRDAIDRFLARKRVSADPSPDERRRLFQQLLRRGFDTGEILKALKKRGAEPDES